MSGRMRSMTASGPCRAQGFTLLEVTIVISLLALLSVIIWPAVDNWLHAAELPESADNFRATLRMARASAGLSGRRHRIRFQRDVQQPYIEYEVDPMNEPGRWEPVKEAWSENDVLLSDVQVVQVIPGRPDYLTPVSHSGGADFKALFEENSFGTDKGLFDNGTNGETPGKAFGLESDEQVDPDRPTIVFEPDGSCDWCTVILAREKPGTKLEMRVKQKWVVLDGRTGLPRIQEPMSAEDLADATKRPDLDKLQPPPTGLDGQSQSDGMDQIAQGLNTNGLDGMGQQMGIGQAGQNGTMPNGDGMGIGQSMSKDGMSSMNNGNGRNGGFQPANGQDANTNGTGRQPRSGGTRNTGQSPVRNNNSGNGGGSRLGSGQGGRTSGTSGK